MASPLVEQTLRRYESAKSRGAWLNHWEDLARVLLPRRLGFVGTPVEGASRTEDIYDNTGMVAARRLANTVGSFLHPIGEPWLFVRTVEDRDENTDENKEWLADTQDRLRQSFENPHARFRQSKGEIELDLVVFGTGELFLGESIGKNRLTFQSVHLKDGIPMWDDEGILQGMFRSRKFTVREAVKRWGKERLSEATRKLFEQDKLEEKVEFLFAVQEREGGRSDAFFATNLPYSDLVIEVDAKHEVIQGGFHEFPYIVPRWDTSSGEKFGRSPGMYALPNANTTQAIGETMLIAGQRSADPALLAPSDAFLDAPNTFPGGLASYEAEAVRDLGANPIRELQTGANFPLTLEIQKAERDQVEEAFLRQVFRLPPAGDAKMTATEIIERREEFIREVGPVFGGLETDYTAPMVERGFNIRLRAGGFRPIPPGLQGKSIRFEYESPVTRIRERANAAAAGQWAREMAELNTIEPGAFDIVDTDGLGRFSADAVGVPHGAVRGADAVNQRRQQRAEAQQAAQDAQMAMAAADTGANLVKATQ